MRLTNFLNELYSQYAKGISFLDIDETIFNTFAKIYVKNGGKVTKKLTNKEFNTYKLQPGESFDFSEFGDSKLFHTTSKPIMPVINRIKRIFTNIERRDSKVVLLTARSTFPDMNTFKDTFHKYNIPINNIDIEFAGDREGHSISTKKKNIIMNYVNTCEYRRVRLIDDDMKNIRTFLSLRDEVPQSTIDGIRQKYNITSDDGNIPIIQFFGLLVLPDGKLKRIL